MGKDPAMPFYVNDWLSSPRVQAMTLPEQAIYLKILCFMWASGDVSVTESVDELYRICQVPEQGFVFGLATDNWDDQPRNLTAVDMERVLKTLAPHPEKPGYLTSPRLRELWLEREENRKKRAAQTEAARAAAIRKRCLKSKQSVTDPVTSSFSSSSSSSSSPKKEEASASSSPELENSTEDDSQAVMEFPCVGKDQKKRPIFWTLYQSHIDEWQMAYPGIDVLAECRKALAWLQANPKRGKTLGGMARFLNSWLSRAQDNTPGGRVPPRSGPSRRRPFWEEEQQEDHEQ